MWAPAVHAAHWGAATCQVCPSELCTPPQMLGSLDTQGNPEGKASGQAFQSLVSLEACLPGLFGGGVLCSPTNGCCF